MSASQKGTASWALSPHWSRRRCPGPVSLQPAARAPWPCPQRKRSWLVLRLTGGSGLWLDTRPQEGSGHTGMLRPSLSPGRSLRPPWELAQVAGAGTGRQDWLRSCHRDGLARQERQGPQAT